MKLADKAKIHMRSSITTTFRMLSSNWKTYFSSSSSSSWTKSPTWWSSSSWDHQWQEWHSREGKTKNGGISDNTDTAKVPHRQVQGDLYGDVRASSPESRIPFVRFSDLFVLSGSLRVQTVATAMNATGVHRKTPHRTQRRALFLIAHACARQMLSHVLLKGLTICFCASRIILSLVMSLLNVPSTPFPPTFSSPTASLTPPYCLSQATDGKIRVNSCATPLWGGPSGHLADPIPNTSEATAQLPEPLNFHHQLDRQHALPTLLEHFSVAFNDPFEFQRQVTQRNRQPLFSV